MGNLILFQQPVPYKWVKEAFIKVIDEYLPTARFKKEELNNWKKYLDYIANQEYPFTTDRISNSFSKDVSTYLELQGIPNQPVLNLYDGIDNVQTDVRIYDDYPIKGIFMTPEIQNSSSKLKKSEERLGRCIKTIVDTKSALECAKNTHKKCS
jgi:hypothetical protein